MRLLNWEPGRRFEHTEKAYLWDKRSRQGRIPVLGMELEVTEFDYSKPQIVYDNNGVVISSWPAIHAIDGPISYSLTWNGLKFVYSGDTSPNKWFIDYGRDADFLIHECFTSVQALMSGSYTAQAAWMVGTRVHTSPQAAGKIFSLLQPRMAVCYHFRNNARTLPIQLESVRQTYGGPLTIAEDFMVWNVTKRQVTTRTVATGDSGARVDRRKVAADPSLMIEKSGWLTDGQMPLPEVDWLTIDTLDPEFPCPGVTGGTGALAAFRMTIGMLEYGSRRSCTCIIIVVNLDKSDSRWTVPALKLPDNREMHRNCIDRPATGRALLLRTLTIIVFVALLRTITTGGPVTTADAADVYFPNTEVLGIDEMRVIALGTGTPNFRRSQASSAWLVELGNGEKFIFDLGTGSLANIAALEIPFTYLDKIFLSHLHVDHIGDLGAMFIGGWVSNRTGPLRVWGPGRKAPGPWDEAYNRSPASDV